MKLQFKLTRRELMIWLNSVEGLAVSTQLSSGTLTKMFVANICELIKALQKLSFVVKQKYTLSIDLAQCLAYQFYVETALSNVHTDDLITINKIIGIIDQKTK